MKRYPLRQLLQLREHRAEQARRAVLERLACARECRDRCIRIEGEVIAIEYERKEQRRRLLDPPPAGVPWPAALAQREAHIDLLGEQAEAARNHLFAAQEQLRTAELALDQARAAFARARARQDALEKRKALWRDSEDALALRDEEAETADLLMARHGVAGWNGMH